LAIVDGAVSRSGRQPSGPDALSGFSLVILLDISSFLNNAGDDCPVHMAAGVPAARSVVRRLVFLVSAIS
jgi:hypothetical protein